MEYIKEIFQYGGTVIMAGLFVYVFLQDRAKNNKLLENIAKSNENIAMALELLKGSIEKINRKEDETQAKVDRNYEAIKEFKIID